MITFKRFTANERLSQETLAFAADVYWQGRKIGNVSNNGHGGQALFHRTPGSDVADYREAESFARQQEMDIGEKGAPNLVKADSLDEYLDWLACDVQAQKQQRAWLKRKLKSSVLFYDGEALKAIARPWMPALEPLIRQRHAGAKILNAMPFEEAFALHAAKLGLKVVPN